MARQRGSRWLADVRLDDGRRLRPAFATEAQANAWESAARLAIQEGRPIPEVRTERAKSSDLSTLGTLFDHVRRTHWASMKAAADLIRNGQHVVDHFGRNKAVAEIGSADVAEFRAELAEKGLSQSTINRKCAALSKMLHVARDAEVIQSVPRIRFAKEEQAKFRYVDEVEERTMLAYWAATGDQDMHDLTTFLVDTGARCYSEAMKAHWDAFGPRFGSVTFWHTKTNRPRTVPLTKRVRDILDRRKGTHGDRAGPFTGGSKDTMKGRWAKMRRATGLHDVTPHTLRHTCCTRLIAAGIDVKRVMTWMGHTELATTMRYMQIKPGGLEDVLAVLERAA
jgi:integrase